jgi:hypothetical protein
MCELGRKSNLEGQNSGSTVYSPTKTTCCDFNDQFAIKDDLLNFLNRAPVLAYDLRETKTPQL